MSKITNPKSEASISCGFYNSLAGDEYPRKYPAEQMSRIFDGLINDGIFQSIGDRFVVEVSSGNTVSVGTGKCWFNHTWTENDAPYLIDCGTPNEILDRIDAIVIRVNSTEAVRDNFIDIVEGEPATYPERPSLKNENGIYEHALCYIYRYAKSESISQSDITNVIGTETPFVTGIVEILKLEDFMLQWQADLDEWLVDNNQELQAWRNNRESDFQDWYSEMVGLMENVVDEIDGWQDDQKTSIMTWFESIKDTLALDPALNLQFQIDTEKIRCILINGLNSGSMTISEDGKSITETDDDYMLWTVFSDDFMTVTKELYYSMSMGGALVGRLCKSFQDDGSCNSTMNLYNTGVDQYLEPELNAIIAIQESYINGEN